MHARPLTARIDLNKASIVSEVKLGEVVVVTLRGRVKEMRGPSESLMAVYSPSGKGKKKEEKYLEPGSLTLEIEKFEIDTKGEFEDPEEDD